MSWDYRKFPHHPLAEEKFEIRGVNTIFSDYHYRVDPNLCKYVCAMIRITCQFLSCVAQLDKYWLTNCSP